MIDLLSVVGLFWVDLAVNVVSIGMFVSDLANVVFLINPLVMPNEIKPNVKIKPATPEWISFFETLNRRI